METQHQRSAAHQIHRMPEYCQRV